jgi:excisionase family DNA binding protein
MDLDHIQSHDRAVFEYDGRVELSNLISCYPAPEKLVEAASSNTPIFDREGNGTIVREVGHNGLYCLRLPPTYALTRIVVEPDDIFVDIAVDNGQLVYFFYNGTRRQSISISAIREEDINSVSRRLSSDLSDPIWRQSFVRDIVLKPDAKPIGDHSMNTPSIMNAAQVARYLGIEEKTVRNWTSAGKIPVKKVGSNARYTKADIDKALEAGQLGAGNSNKSASKKKTPKNQGKGS